MSTQSQSEDTTSQRRFEQNLIEVAFEEQNILYINLPIFCSYYGDSIVMRHHREAESDEIALYCSSIVATFSKHTANLDGNMRRSVCT